MKLLIWENFLKTAEPIVPFLSITYKYENPPGVILLSSMTMNLLLIFVLLIGLNFTLVSAVSNVNMKITGTIGDYTSDMWS